MADTRCPWCKEDIDVWNSDDWEEPEFDTSCPNCGKPLNIVVEVVEYRYTARKGEGDDE